MKRRNFLKLTPAVAALPMAPAVAAHLAGEPLLTTRDWDRAVYLGRSIPDNAWEYFGGKDSPSYYGVCPCDSKHKNWAVAIYQPYIYGFEREGHSAHGYLRLELLSCGSGDVPNANDHVIFPSNHLSGRYKVRKLFVNNPTFVERKTGCPGAHATPDLIAFYAEFLERNICLEPHSDTAQNLTKIEWSLAHSSLYFDECGNAGIEYHNPKFLQAEMVESEIYVGHALVRAAILAVSAGRRWRFPADNS